MKKANKYMKQFFLPDIKERKWVKKSFIEKAPIWCSVDLRDGNQALITPMNIDEKLEFFNLLVEIGFKQIEIGFPAASKTEYDFLRLLIDNNLIPDDVTIQVLTQSRKHIIEKTFEALKGCKNAIVHLYNSTSKSQREQVFNKSKNEIIEIATYGAKLFNDIASEYDNTNWTYEYSPESFTGTELDFALQICNEVIDIWEPKTNNKIIINLPVTVEHSIPSVYADQVEYMSDNLNYRDNVLVSIHPHNDRGTAIADAELGILAGGDRIEGTLFGNGERTGNVDIITLALNMYSQGVEPNLDFSDIQKIKQTYEKVTKMSVYDRQPYSGNLVFAAFSGSHQDAISKGIKYHKDNNLKTWTVPYLPIDPQDLGRIYETDVIRINSQSGKGGISYILENNYNYIIPKEMREVVGYYIKSISDKLQKELTLKEIFDFFNKEFVNRFDNLKLESINFSNNQNNTSLDMNIVYNNDKITINQTATGRFECVAEGLKKYFKNLEFNELTYNEHSVDKGADSKAITYLSYINKKNKKIWGVGIDSDIIMSSIYALFSAINREENI